MLLLCKRRYHLNALFHTQVYLGCKFCLSFLEPVDLEVPAQHISVCSSSKNCPPAICVSAANVVCRDVDVSGIRTILLIVFYNLYLIINYKNFNCSQYLFMDMFLLIASWLV
jgi:hypothetical protein